MEREKLIKGLKILQLEGKDILLKDIQTHDDAKSKNKTYKLKTYLFKANLDYSLDVLKLNEVVNKTSIEEIEGKIYTTAIVTVNFNYSIKDKNKHSKTEMTTKDIREKLYEEGFYIKIKGQDKHFVRYKRSSGSAREGKCLFIQEDYYKKMMDWSLMGIDPSKNGNQLPSLEAYISLTTSSIIDTMKIEPKNILLIDDKTSTFKDTVMATELKDGKLVTSEKEVEITNKIWDGQSLIDISLLEYKYKEKGALQIRNRFFKGMCFNANIQEFFKDNNITDISQLNGQTIAKDIKDIKLITTPSSVKYVKFGKFEDWISQVDEEWGICKYEKKTKFFGGKMVQTHYQLLNTINLTKNEVTELLEPTLHYFNLLKNDLTVFKNHIKCNYNVTDEDMNKEEVELKMTNDFMINMIKYNNDFEHTKIFKNFKYEVIKSAKNNLKRGHILINGNYSVVCSNAIEMLKESINKWDGETSVLEKKKIYCNRWGANTELLGCRSPHVTMGNLLIAENEKVKDIDTYMNSTKQIVHITSIGDNILERMSGMDFDGDQFILTDNKTLIDATRKHYDKFLVPTNTVKNANKTSYEWDSVSKSKLDYDTSVNKIGEIINLSALLNAEYWQRFNNKDVEDLEELYALICQLDVLSCIEIDKAKKPSPVDVINELDNSRNSGFLRECKPQFFKFIRKEKGCKSGKYANYKITIDRYLKELTKVKYTKRSGIDFLEILFSKNSSKFKTGKANQRQIEKYLGLLNTYKTNQSKLWIDKNFSNEEKYKNSEILKKDLIEKISEVDMKKETIITILKRLNNDLIDEKKNTDYTNNQRIILLTLYNVYKVKFLELIKFKATDCKKLVRDKDGELEIFGVRYTKKYIKIKGE